MKTNCFYITSAILSLFILLFASPKAQSQMVDSTAYVSIISELKSTSGSGEGRVSVNQSSDIASLLRSYALTSQKNQSMQGYRVRIFRDNSQHARDRMYQVKNVFEERYPEHKAYPSHSNPYFMVTVGNFRTIDEATKFANQLKADYGGDYGSVYPIESKIFFPSL